MSVAHVAAMADVQRDDIYVPPPAGAGRRSRGNAPGPMPRDLAPSAWYFDDT